MPNDMEARAQEVLREHGIIGGKHLPQTVAAMLAFAARSTAVEWEADHARSAAVDLAKKLAARPAVSREAVAAKAIAGALFEHVSGKYGVRWEGLDLPEEYQFRGLAMEHLARLRADAILQLLQEQGER